MANPLRGEVRVACLDGVERVLLFDVNAFCELEAEFDEPFGRVVQRLATPSARDLRAMLAIGLKARQPEIDRLTAGTLLRLGDMAEAVGAAFQAALPRAEAAADGAADPREAAGGTGSNS